MEYLVGFALLIFAGWFLYQCYYTIYCDCGGKYNRLVSIYLTYDHTEKCYACSKCDKTIKIIS